MNSWLYGIGQDGTSAPASVAERLLTSRRDGFFAPPRLLLGAPFSYVDVGALADPAWWYTAVLLANVSTPIGAVNMLILFGYAGTSIASYALFRCLALPRLPAFAGAIAYGFCPIRLAEGQEHFLLLDGFWLVVEAGLLFASARLRTFRWPVLLGCCIALAELDNPYLGYFAGILAISWFLVTGIEQAACRNWRSVARLVSRACVALAVLLIVVVPMQWSLLTVGKTPEQAYDNASSLDRSLGDLDRLSLRWWNFFLPFPDNPVLGPFGRPTFYAHLGVDTVTEQSTMTGYTVLILAGLGAFCVFRIIGRRSVREPGASDLRWRHPVREDFGKIGAPRYVGPFHRDLARFALVCIVGGILFGLPPELRFGSVLVYTPPYFIHLLLPGIRTNSRIDLVVQLGIAIFSAYGTAYVLAKVHFPLVRNLLAGLILVAILLEYTNVPPWRYVKLLPSPPIYQWLASLTPEEAGIVVQYPIAPSDMARTPLYAFYAYDVHHHPLFNGVLRGTPPDALRRNLLDLLNPTNPAAWSALGVKSVTVDTSYYAETFHNSGLAWLDGSPGFSHRLPVGLVLRHVDSAATGYAVRAAPSAVVVGLGDDFGDPVLEMDGREWQWIDRQATVWLDNFRSSPVNTVLWTVAHNNASSHTLSWPGYLTVPISAAQRDVPVAIAVTAKQGMHSLLLSSAGPQQPLQGGDNPTPVSLELRSLEPAPVRPINAIFLQNGKSRWILKGVSADACSVQAGASFDVALLWHINAPTETDQTVFLHLIDSSGSLVAQDDGLPNAGTIATSREMAVPDVSDVRTLVLPPSLPPGAYELQVGLYDPKTMVRLPLASGGDMANLGSVAVVARSDGPLRIPCSW